MKSEEFNYPMDENGTSSSLRLQVLADLRIGEFQDDSGMRIVEYLKKLSEITANMQEVQESVASITKEILSNPEIDLPTDNILLMPIMRSGIAMWNSANQHFGYPETSFLWGVKEKGTNNASVLWPVQNNTNKNVIILDPIIATGDTIIQSLQALTSHSEKIHSITVIGCYASPEGIRAILENTDINLVVGCLSETVNSDGYLIPPTNGDMGNKLFGSASE